MISKRVLGWFARWFGYDAITGTTTSDIALRVPDGELKGSLSLPHTTSKVPLVLFISGSGPTDRDGNGPGRKNGSLKKLARRLASAGIASVRYDKRGVGQSAGVGLAEIDLRFEHYVNDAIAWLAFLRRDDRFSKFVVLGHSEGALIGMLAAHAAGADGYISVAGADAPASVLVGRQLERSLPANLLAESERIMSLLVKGQTAENVPAALAKLFRPSVQPYLISWFKYDPARVFSQLNTASLLVHGTADLQIGAEAASNLQKARSETALAVIPGMNHVLKMSKGSVIFQWVSYATPLYAVSCELTRVIANFVTRL